MSLHNSASVSLTSSFIGISRGLPFLVQRPLVVSTTIRAWLGHVSIDTANIYAETDLEMKAKALATCEVKETKRSRRWKDKGLMTFLRAGHGSDELRKEAFVVS